MTDRMTDPTTPRPDPVTEARDALLDKCADAVWNAGHYTFGADLDNLIALARAEAGVSVDRYIESVPPLDFIVMQRVRRGRSMSWEVYDMPNTDSPREAATGPTLAAALAALAARSAGSGSRVERECVCGHGWADHGLTGGCEAEWGTGDGDVFCPCTHTRPTPPPAGATQVPLPATDSTPPPAVDGTRCAECGGVKDDVFHVPCLVGGPFHYVKTCHPFTPPAPEPSAALVEELLRRIEESGHCRWCYVVTRADLDIIVAAAYREPRGPR